MRVRNRSFASGCLSALVVTIASILVAPAQAAAQEGERETFIGFAVVTSGVARGGTTILNMHIDGWTSDADRERLTRAIVGDESSKLVDILRDLDEVGFVQVPGRPGYRLRYARSVEQGGRRRIILATDRPIGLVESMTSTRSLRYQITLIELLVDAEGNGEGAVIVGAKIDFDAEEQSVTVTSYGSAPVRLTNVRRSD